MSRQADGSYRCDGPCGGNDVVNGSIHYAAIITDLDATRPFQIQQLHMCRQPSEAAPDGCAALLRAWLAGGAA